jgi:hypothetical protein
MHVYLNYSNPHITIHKDPNCGQIHMHHRQGQRRVCINTITLRFVLSDFINEKYAFRSVKHFNDLWLEINLDTPAQETGLVHVIQAILGQRYSPFSDAPVIEHCYGEET